MVIGSGLLYLCGGGEDVEGIGGAGSPGESGVFGI